MRTSPTAAAHDLRIGRPEAHPWLAGQTRVTFARCGVVDPASVADYRAYGGFEGLVRARAIGPALTIDALVASGLRGRGGAGFPAGVKWKTVADAPGDAKYIVCNADEGDSGTFADRMILEGDPFVLIEGMAIAGHGVGARKGFVYSRSEYPHANRAFQGPSTLSAPMAPWGLSTSSFASAQAPMSAARRRRCWRAWRASAARFAPSRPCRRIGASLASRRWSTTCSPWPPRPGS